MRRRIARISLGALIASLAPVNAEAGWGQSLIARDVAAEAGIARTSLTAGENCVFDYNRDGVKDLFLSTHDEAPWQLFRGKRNGTFAETNIGTFPLRDRHGCATADFNGDGRPDIYRDRRPKNLATTA